MFPSVFASTSALAVVAFALSASAPACSGSSNNAPAADASPSGSGDDSALDAAPSGPVAGDDTQVVGFAKKQIFFGGKDENRTADVTATFPSSGRYSKITMHLTLECPQGGCDWWDRFGTLGIVQKGAGDAGSDAVIEIARFITPYRIGAKWDIDVTSLRPLLSGDVTLRAFIDTWVPQTGSNNGNGWLVSTSFDMTGGVPDAGKDPVAVIPIWTRSSVVYGDPAKPIAASATAQTVDLAPLAAAGATAYGVRTFITGHGQGNADNCAEFCSRKHTIAVQSKPHTQTVWRTDCATTAVKGQAGTSDYDRAGWCPGATVRPWEMDITADLAGAPSAAFTYDVESYVNSCRPAAATDDAGTCSGCTLNTGCAYDGGNHTEPYYVVSSLLIGYR